MAAGKLTTDRGTPRFNRRRVSAATKIPTTLNRERDAGLKWKTSHPCRANPRSILGVRASGAIVADRLRRLASRNTGVGRIQSSDELLMAVALRALADDRDVENIHRSKQRRFAVPPVVAGHCPCAAPFGRQPGVGAVERPNLALLVRVQGDRVSGRIHAEPGNIGRLSLEFGIFGKIQLRRPTRLKATLESDAPNGTAGEARGLRRRRAGPARRLARRRLEPQGHCPRDNIRSERSHRRTLRAAAGRFIEPFAREPSLPALDARFRVPIAARDLVRADAVRHRKHDPTTPSGIPRWVPVSDQGHKPTAISHRRRNGYLRAHPPGRRIQYPRGCLRRIRMSKSVN